MEDGVEAICYTCRMTLEDITIKDRLPIAVGNRGN
jgi:hypothetical protein